MSKSVVLISWLCLYTAVRTTALGQEDSVDEADFTRGLTSLIQKSSIEPDQVYTQALGIINSFESAPSCHRLATAALINSCQSLELSQSNSARKSQHTQAILDSQKSAFAARLAVCELTGANAAVPDACSSLLPGRHDQQSFLRFFKVTRHLAADAVQDSPVHKSVKRKELDQCLSALESKPQWWTSYSNARQNAIIICRAVRNEVEKGDLLNAHRGMTGIIADLSRFLAVRLRHSEEVIEKQQFFHDTLRNFQAQLVKDLQAARQESNTVVSRVLKKAEDAIQSATQKLITPVLQAKEELDKLATTFSNIVQAARNSEAELAHSQQRVLTTQRAHSQDLEQQSLEFQQRQMGQFTELFAGLQQELAFSSQLIQLMNDKHTGLDNRLSALDSSFKDLQLRTEQLQISQTQQSEAYHQLQGKLEAQLNITSDMVTRVTEGLAQLDTAVDETLAKVLRLPFSGGFLPSLWSPLVCVVGLLFGNQLIAGSFTVVMAVLIVLSRVRRA